MRIDPACHRVVVVRFVPSPNYDERPVNMPLSLVVLDNISLPLNEFGGPYIEQLFTKQLDPKAHPYFKNNVD